MCQRCSQQTSMTGQPTRIWVHGVEQQPSPELFIQARLAEVEWALMEMARTRDHVAPAAIGSAVTLVQAARAEIKRARLAREASTRSSI